MFDGELTGSQIRNISTALGGLEVIDRTMLILEIFRSRAVTNEGKLQTANWPCCAIACPGCRAWARP